MFKKLLAGLSVAVLSLGGVVLVTAPASAHQNTVSASIACATDGYAVTWTVVNSEPYKSEEITASSNPGLVAVGTVLAPAETKTFVQKFASPQDASLTLTGFWADGAVSSTNSASVTASQFPTGCYQATPQVSVTQSQCTGANQSGDAGYTLAGVGVAWLVNGVPTAAGTYTAKVGVPFHIEAKPIDARYTLVGKTVWDYTFAAASSPYTPCYGSVEPVVPTVTQQVCDGPGDYTLATYTIPAVTGVIYFVKVDGGTERKVGAGTYNLPDGAKTVQFIARADSANYYVITGGDRTYDVVQLTLAGECLLDVAVAKPEFTDAVCSTTAPGAVPPSTYTLLYVDHVIYEVSTNGGPKVDAVITSDTTYTVPAGTQITVTIRSDDPTGYQTPAYLETHTFANPGDCRVVLTPVAPTTAAQTCSDADPITGAPLADPMTVSGTIVIPSTPNVTYYIDGVLRAAGTWPATPGAHVVSVTYDTTKYTLPTGLVVPFAVTVGSGACLPTEPLVTPSATSTQPSCFAGGSVTLSNDLGDPSAVSWTVDGVGVPSGSVAVQNAGTVTVTATPNAPSFGFASDTQTSWTFSFARPGCDLATLALTGQSPTGLLAMANILILGGLSLVGVRALRARRNRLTAD